jgi:hypothetical protein
MLRAARIVAAEARFGNRASGCCDAVPGGGHLVKLAFFQFCLASPCFKDASEHELGCELENTRPDVVGGQAKSRSASGHYRKLCPRHEL